LSGVQLSPKGFIMNQFNCFPLNVNQREIITIKIDFYYSRTQKVHVERKIKCGCKTSATNAFHMHRALCRGFKEEISWVRDCSLTVRQVSLVKKILGQIVLADYLKNAEAHTQFFHHALWLNGEVSLAVMALAFPAHLSLIEDTRS